MRTTRFLPCTRCKSAWYYILNWYDLLVSRVAVRYNIQPKLWLGDALTLDRYAG